MLNKLSKLKKSNGCSMVPVYCCLRCGEIITLDNVIVTEMEDNGVSAKLAHICEHHIFEDGLTYNEIGIAELIGYDEV